jgi:hypothetical protein
MTWHDREDKIIEALKLLLDRELASLRTMEETHVRLRFRSQEATRGRTTAIGGDSGSSRECLEESEAHQNGRCDGLNRAIDLVRRMAIEERPGYMNSVFASREEKYDHRVTD